MVGLNAVVVERSSGVELRDLVVRGPVGDGTRVTPTGILVEADGSWGCGPSGCRQIALVDDTVKGVADEAVRSPASCASGSLDAFGITVRDRSGALREVVIEGVHVRDARTGASEVVSLNGGVAGFLLRDNTVTDGDNIGIDIEGGYGGSLPARYGLVTGNEVANIDSLTNTMAGARLGRVCVGQESAAGIYDDGARDVAITRNRVFDTNQGISLDAEVPHATSSAILVAGNLVVDLPGTSAGPSSLGHAAGVPLSTMAGHAFDALYVDTYGPGSMVDGVLVLENRLVNRSRFFSPDVGYRAVVVAIGGRSAQVRCVATPLGLGPEGGWWRSRSAGAPRGSSLRGSCRGGACHQDLVLPLDPLEPRERSASSSTSGSDTPVKLAQWRPQSSPVNVIALDMIARRSMRYWMPSGWVTLGWWWTASLWWCPL